MPTRIEMLRPYIESVLERMYGLDRIEPDTDGDYPLPPGQSTFFVRPVDANPPTVHVFAVAVRDVPPSPELLAALNELNSRARFARVFHVRDQVLAEHDLLAETLDAQDLAAACATIGDIAQRVGPPLAAKFGGAPGVTPPAAEAEPEPGEAGWRGYL